MFPTISTQYGRGRALEPAPIMIPTQPAAALAFAIRADRDAEAEQQAGNVLLADRLAHAAIEAQCRASGRRA